MFYFDVVSETHSLCHFCCYFVWRVIFLFCTFHELWNLTAKKFRCVLYLSLALVLCVLVFASWPWANPSHVPRLFVLASWGPTCSWSPGWWRCYFRLWWIAERLNVTDAPPIVSSCLRFEISLVVVDCLTSPSPCAQALDPGDPDPLHLHVPTLLYVIVSL